MAAAGGVPPTGYPDDSPALSPGESIAAYNARLDGTDIDRAQAAVGATRTAQFPLVEDWHPTPPLAAPSPTAPLSSPQRTDD